MFFCNNCDNMLYMKIEEIQEQSGSEGEGEIEQSADDSELSFVKKIKLYIIVDVVIRYILIYISKKVVYSM